MVQLVVEDFGKFSGDDVKKYTWKTDSGFSVSVISYGAIIQAIKVPDSRGNVKDVVLGFDKLEDYVKRNSPYLGATVGRVANRIGGANFYIDDVLYQLKANIPPNHLHGGIRGFDKVNWSPTVDGTKLILSYLSRDKEEGYPGDLITNLTFEVKDDDSVHLKYLATATKKTPVNLTNHSYFNLAGHDSGVQGLREHSIVINADKITETSSSSIPSGKLLDVGGTKYDLRVAANFDDLLKRDNSLYDDNFCVNRFDEGLSFVSRVTHPPSGRFLELHSDQPGVQLYTSNFLPPPAEPALVGKQGVGYRQHGAFCLETQKYPDAVHHPDFESTILKPGDIYVQNTVFKFGAETLKIQPKVTIA